MAGADAARTPEGPPQVGRGVHGRAQKDQGADRSGLNHPPSRGPPASRAQPRFGFRGQTKPSKIAWFYSSESGLFNGLRRIQIKNLFLSRAPPQIASSQLSLILFPTRRRPADLASRKTCRN